MTRKTIRELIHQKTTRFDNASHGIHQKVSHTFDLRSVIDQLCLMSRFFRYDECYQDLRSTKSWWFSKIINEDC